jgi:hypothetical protein
MPTTKRMVKCFFTVSPCVAFVFHSTVLQFNTTKCVMESQGHFLVELGRGF